MEHVITRKHTKAKTLACEEDHNIIYPCHKISKVGLHETHDRYNETQDIDYVLWIDICDFLGISRHDLLEKKKHISKTTTVHPT